MSDLQGLHYTGIYVKVLFRNPSYTSDQIRQIKLGSGPLTNDAAWYVDACSSFNQSADEPFNSWPTPSNSFERDHHSRLASGQRFLLFIGRQDIDDGHRSAPCSD